MKDECVICKAPLEYLKQDALMECVICHKKENSKTRCVNGHYVCNECHMKGMDSIIGVCMHSDTKNPVELLEQLMSMPFCHMHGPEHHVIVGASLLTAYKNAGGDVDLETALIEMVSRGKSVPGGACGFWGACGAGISTGMFISIVTKATPLAKEAWGLANQMTSKALGRIGEIGGPRCCKRDSYLAMIAAVEFVKENLGVEMELGEIKCSRSANNNQCIQGRCPFYKPKIAFICVHNSCRSQMAEAFGKKYLDGLYECYSAGTETKPQINQDAVRIMQEHYGIDMSAQYSKLLKDIPEADIYISMGCNVQCPVLPGKRMENWGLEDPTGQSDEVFLEIAEKIREKVLELKEEIK